MLIGLSGPDCCPIHIKDNLNLAHEHKITNLGKARKSSHSAHTIKIQIC